MTSPVFFSPVRAFAVSEIATLTGAQLTNPALADTPITGIASVFEGGKGRLVFSEGRRNAEALKSLDAGAVLCSAEFSEHVPAHVACLITPHPQWAFAIAAKAMYPDAARPQALTGEKGVSDRAIVSPDAELEAGVIVEAGAVIGPGVAVGSGSVIAANAVLGAMCQVGRDCYVGPCASVQHSLIGNRVVIHGGAQIGREGFGFVAGMGSVTRLPQIGRVIIQDDVEIGANSTVDRGAIGDTVIGEGTKIDNLVQVAHNVQIGRYCMIAGNVGLSGSVKVGDGAQIGGGAGIADHLTIGAGAQLAAGSGLMNDIPAGERWGGYPAMPFSDKMREIAALRRLTKVSRGKKDGE